MQKYLTYITTISISVFFVIPCIASAHALPIEMEPASSVATTHIPQNVRITFTERIDASASFIRVTGPTGGVASEGVARINATNDRVLSIPFLSDGDGTYTVSWGAVSSDDGHFTKGAYTFAIGTSTATSLAGASTAEMIQIATKPEALSMTIELIGHGFLWAILLLLIFILRPLFASGRFAGEQSLIYEVCVWIIAAAVSCVVLGDIGQLYVKAYDVITLQSVPFLTALVIYSKTAAGTATLCRLVAALMFLCIFVLGRKTIFSSQKITPYDVALFALLCVFAYFRAKISHATSNPFHPHFSIGINLIHLIEKDVWAGITGTLLLFSCIPRLRTFVHALIPRVFTMLAIDFASVSITACYIVWLHLKSPDNLFRTQWGAAFLELFLVALLLVTLRIYHVSARLWKRRFFSQTFLITLAVECACAVLVIYYSSVVIITSPPLLQPTTTTLRTENQGLTITLARDSFEDGQLLLRVSGNNGNVRKPVAVVEGDTSAPDTLSVSLRERFPGEYTFPASILVGESSHVLTITIPQVNAYDAHATFSITKGMFDPKPQWQSKRNLDSFALSIIVTAILALLCALALLYVSKRSIELPLIQSNRLHVFLMVVSFLVVVLAIPATILSIRTSGIENPFKARCEADGNMWHTMPPTRAGVPLSQNPVEGCMWGMGIYTYLFPDEREYLFKSSLPHAMVTLDTASAQIAAGVPETLTVHLTEADGSPARLFVDMEKLIHVVIISKDQTVFAHIHPDDMHPLTDKEITTSTFTLPHTFPTAGEYVVSVDYAHGLTLESKQFAVHVVGEPTQGTTKLYPKSSTFNDYAVTLDYANLVAGEVATLKYTIEKNGKPVSNLHTYLSAAMHISVIKNDLSSFLHVHGEIHPPGVPLPPITVKNGQVIHSMAMMTTPETFGSPVEAHLVFPTPGLYTIWGEFKADNKVIPTAFTVQVE